MSLQDDPTALHAVLWLNAAQHAVLTSHDADFVSQSIIARAEALAKPCERTPERPSAQSHERANHRSPARSPWVH